MLLLFRRDVAVVIRAAAASASRPLAPRPLRRCHLAAAPMPVQEAQNACQRGADEERDLKMFDDMVSAVSPCTVQRNSALAESSGDRVGANRDSLFGCTDCGRSTGSRRPQSEQGCEPGRSRAARRITHCMRRLPYLVATLLVSAPIAFGAQASAVPPRLRPPLRQTPLTVSRATRVSGTPLLFSPLRSELRAAQVAPIKPLPLVPPVRAKVLPVFLPLALAAPAIPFAADTCTAARSGMLFTSLPAGPFTPIACQRDGLLGETGDRATALVPGGNKNALYGPAYSAHDFSAP